MRPDVSRRLRDSDYAAVCRARLYGDDGRREPPPPANPVNVPDDAPAVVADLAAAEHKPRFTPPLRRAFLISAIAAAVLVLPLPVALDRPELLWDRARSAAATILSGFDAPEMRSEPA